MVAIASGLETVIVRVVRATRPVYERAIKRKDSPDNRTAEYMALVYARVDLPLRRPEQLPTGQQREWSGEPLAGVQPFTMSWGHYDEYLATYMGGAKGAYLMRERLFDALPDELEAVLAGNFGAGQRSRTWFSSEAPELDELPWELVAYANGQRAQSGSSFVRGLPPEVPSPLVPVRDQLRLALLDPLEAAPAGLLAALDELGPQLDVSRISAPIREGMHAAASGGFELVHLVADGLVTASYDGVLHFPDTPEGELTAGETAGLLRGSRVRVIGLTSARSGDPALTTIGHRRVPSAYRAFTYFATSPMTLPNIVAPQGPLGDHEVHRFWRTFYEELCATHELDGSIARAQQSEPLAMSLFLRQLQLPTFRRVKADVKQMAEPGAAKVQLETSKELVAQLETLRSKHGVRTKSLDAFVDKERMRQTQLEAEVSEWVEGVDEE